MVYNSGLYLTEQICIFCSVFYLPAVHGGIYDAAQKSPVFKSQTKTC